MQWILCAISSRWEGLITQYSLQWLWFCLLSGKKFCFLLYKQWVNLIKGEKTPLKADFFIPLALLKKEKVEKYFWLLIGKKKVKIATLGTVNLGNVPMFIGKHTMDCCSGHISEEAFRSCYLKVIKASSFPLKGRCAAESTAPARLWALLHPCRGDLPCWWPRTSSVNPGARGSHQLGVTRG